MRKSIGLLLAIIGLIPAIVIAGGGTETQATQIQAGGGEAQTIIDHIGKTVKIPANPQRIAALHGSTTAMLVELGASIIGTATRPKMPDKKPYIRYAFELFGTTVEANNWYDYGPIGKDLEKVKLSQPDLIVACVHHYKNHEVLTNIAPTVYIQDGVHPGQPRLTSLEVYRNLATWIGKEQRFQELYTDYEKRLNEVKKLYTKGDTFVVIAYPNVNKGKYFMGFYGAQPDVANELGLHMLPYAKSLISEGKAGTDISAEIILDLNADYIFSLYSEQHNQQPSDILNAFDEISPGWRKHLDAYKNNRFIIFNNEKAVSPIKGHLYMLDMFEKHAK